MSTKIRSTKNENKKLKEEYKANLLSKLTEVSEIFDRELMYSNNVNYKELKRELCFLSKDITILISNPPEELDRETYMILKAVSIQIRDLSNHFFALGDEVDEFDKKCIPVMKYIRDEAIPLIRKKLYNSN